MTDKIKICKILDELNISYDISKFIITPYINFCKHNQIDLYGRGDHCEKCHEEFFKDYNYVHVLLYVIDKYSQRWAKCHGRCCQWCKSFYSDEMIEKHN